MQMQTMLHSLEHSKTTHHVRPKAKLHYVPNQCIALSTLLLLKYKGTFEIQGLC